MQNYNGITNREQSQINNLIDTMIKRQDRNTISQYAYHHYSCLIYRRRGQQDYLWGEFQPRI